jgi:hypothetical protein
MTVWAAPWMRSTLIWKRFGWRWWKLKADIDLSVIFYDLTAFVAHGRYPQSRKVKTFDIVA